MKRRPFILFLVLSMIHPLLRAQQHYFIENKGQWPSKVLFKTNIDNNDVWIEKGKTTYVLHDSKALSSFHNRNIIIKPDSILHQAVSASFLHYNPKVTYQGQELVNGVNNYFLGKRTGASARRFNKVVASNIYEGIDLVFYFKNGTLKYDLVLQSQLDVSRIEILYVGHNGLRLDNGSLSIKTGLGNFVERAPYTYDLDNAMVPSQYHLNGDTLTFKVKKQGLLRRNKSITIDPELIFSTYSGSVADNFGYTATYDSNGNGYAGGSVFAFGFPTTTGAYSTAFNGGVIDIGITKYNSNGSGQIYSTYIGGIGDDHPHSMIVNGEGELIVLGSSSSVNFPTTIGSYDRVLNEGTGNQYDIVLFKLSEDGTNLLASTFIGGSNDDGINGGANTSAPTNSLVNNYADNFRGEVLVDTSGVVYVASSSNSNNFPTRQAIQSNLNGRQNAVVFSMSSSLSQLLWSTYYGSVETAGYGIALGLGNDLYCVGGTIGNGLITRSNSYQRNYQGGKTDGFILALNKQNGSGFGSYLGTRGKDQAYLVETDNSGKPYIFGQTTGTWPITPNTYFNSNGGQFIIRMNRDLSSFDKSMVFGSGGNLANISPTAFLVDQCERIFISGWGGNTNADVVFGRDTIADFNGGNTFNMPLTDPLQSNTEGSDFYLAVFSKNLEDLLYGSYFGGTGPNNEEHVDGGTSRFDEKGVIYHSVCASCNSSNSGFPTTANAYSRTNNGKRPNSSNPGCNNALFKIDFESFNRKPVVKDTLFEVIATESLNFSYLAQDPDNYDSVFLTQTNSFDSSQPSTLPIVSILDDISQSTLLFSWTPGCEFAGDTFYIYTKALDQGCPTTDSSFATIKIYVAPPPLTPMPDVICLTFDENNLPEISWEDFETNTFAKEVKLFRSLNGQTPVELKTIPASPGKYNETVDLGFTTNDYCYFFTSENICGKKDTSYAKACTLKEFTNPIPGENIILVTVEKDSFIKVVWNRSDENDFKGYRVYRKSLQSDEFSTVGYVDLQNDTQFLDKNVKVDDFSYCYYVIVEDNCGNKSLPIDTSCSILLTGKEFPFYFTTSSNEYIYWQSGVDYYELWSSVDTGDLRFKQTLDDKTGPVEAKDDNLDYDWGGYYYQYRAYNNTNDTTPQRVSHSNTIYLIQPPLLHVPSAFSPNGDGFNDEWGIVDVFVKEYQILVFNRWGEKVYDSKDKNGKWYATYKGDEQKGDNVYIWIAYYSGWDNKNYTQKGNVTVIR